MYNVNSKGHLKTGGLFFLSVSGFAHKQYDSRFLK